MGCWLCGRNGTADPLDRHHIFGGANRKKSEKYGLAVCLCHNECHIFGANSAHRSRETAERLYRYGQAKAMRENGWTIDDFRREFGANYLDEGAGDVSPSARPWRAAPSSEGAGVAVGSHGSGDEPFDWESFLAYAERETA